MSVNLVGDCPSVLSLIGENYRSDHETSDSESDSTASVISFSTSSESEESSSSEAEGDDDKDKEDTTTTTENEIKEKEKVKKKKKEIPKVKGELSLDDLPRIEDLHISVPHESTRPVGFIKSFVVPLVVIEGLPSNRVPALNIDTVLFLEKGDRALGHIFEIFGPVKQPYYCVRFNSKDHIDEKGIKVGMEVYCAPSTPHTIYVLVAQLQQMKGTDASWTDDYERPDDEEEDFSDDEKERASRKNKTHTNGTNTNTTTATGPTNGRETEQQDRQVIRPHRRGRGRGGQINQNPNQHYLNGWAYAPVNNDSALVPFPVPRHQHQSRPNRAHLTRVPQHLQQQQRPPYIPTLLVPGFYPPRRYPFQSQNQYQYPNHSNSTAGRMEIIQSQQRPIYSQAHLPHRLAILPPPPPPPPTSSHGQSQQIIPETSNQHPAIPTPAQFMEMFQNYYPALYQQQQQTFLNNFPNPTTTTPIQFPNTNSTLTQQTHYQLPLNPNQNQSSTPPPPGV